MSKTVRTRYVAVSKDEISSRNCWINGVNIGDEFPLSKIKYKKVIPNSNYYEDVIKRGTYFCYVDGDLPVEINVDVYEVTTETTVTRKKI